MVVYRECDEIPNWCLAIFSSKGSYFHPDLRLQKRGCGSDCMISIKGLNFPCTLSFSPGWLP